MPALGWHRARAGDSRQARRKAEGEPPRRRRRLRYGPPAGSLLSRRPSAQLVKCGQNVGRFGVLAPRRSICPAAPPCVTRPRGLRARQRKTGTRRRRLSVDQHVLLHLAHLQFGDTYGRLTAGFSIGVATAYLYSREVIDILAAALTLAEATKTVRAKAFVMLDGALLPIDRNAADTPYLPRRTPRPRHERPGLHRPARPTAVGPTHIVRIDP